MRLHSCSAWKGCCRPSLCNDWCPGSSRQCCCRGSAAVAVYQQPWTFLLWRRSKSRWEGAHCEKTVDCPQVQFLAWFLASADGWDEPSITHSCELSRARGSGGVAGNLLPGDPPPICLSDSCIVVVICGHTHCTSQPVSKTTIIQSGEAPF